MNPNVNIHVFRWPDKGLFDLPNLWGSDPGLRTTALTAWGVETAWALKQMSLALSPGSFQALRHPVLFWNLGFGVCRRAQHLLWAALPVEMMSGALVLVWFLQLESGAGDQDLT